MIICDVCEKLIVVVPGNTEKIICGNCGFDNSYQIESDAFEPIVEDIVDYYTLDDDRLADFIVERYGVLREDAYDAIIDSDTIDRYLKGS